MQFRKAIYLLSLIFCMLLSSQAFAAQWGDFTYEASGGTITITRYTGAGGAVVVPDAIEGKPVVSIGYAAFAWFSGLTSVAFPSSLVSIGDYAFAECMGLTSVGIIPAGVTSIGEAAFSSCRGLGSINVDTGNPAYISQDGVLYNKNKTVLVQCPAGKEGVFAIPGSVTRIGAEAFRYCTRITGLTIPDSVTSIGYRGCARMYALTGVHIPASVTSIGTYGFFGGMSNTGITVDANNPNYSSLDGVLYNKNKTELIQYPCGKAGALIIPASVTSIGIAAFELAGNNVTSITFTGNVESIAEAAFEGLTGLTSITFPSSLTSIGNWAFWGDTSLTSAYFYGNAPTMSLEVFDYCASGFTVYYLAGATGFTNPWYGYPTAVFTPPDVDNDGIADPEDNCPGTPNGQTLGTCTASSDKAGATCTTDADCAIGCSTNGICDKEQGDADEDGIGDVCDSCDDLTGEGETTTYYRDADSDSYGNSSLTTLACAVPPGYVADSTDCNDSNVAVKPGAMEVCNGIDDNCNGQTDEGPQTTYYHDADSDSYGNASVTTLACAAPAGYVTSSTDCNDSSAAVNPGAAEVCNGIDDNCNGQTDESACTTTTIPPPPNDADNDGIADPDDNCPGTPNGPTLGTCTPSSDKPGLTCNSDADCAEGCSTNGTCSMGQEDADADGKGDVCDN